MKHTAPTPRLPYTTPIPSAAIRQYKQELQRQNVEIPKQPQPESVQQSQAKKDLTPREIFDNMVKDGKIPTGSEFIGIENDQIKYYTPEQVKQRDTYNTAINNLKIAEKTDGTYDLNKLFIYAKNNKSTYKQTFKDAGLQIPENIAKRIDAVANIPDTKAPKSSTGGIVEPGWKVYAMGGVSGGESSPVISEGDIPDTLKDYPVYVIDQYRQALKDGRDVVKAVNEAIDYYNGFLKRTDESRATALKMAEAEELKFRENLAKTDAYLYGIYVNQGLDAYNEAVKKRAKDLASIDQQFRSENVIIDNQAMPIKDWNELPPEYQKIAVKSGFDAMFKQMDTDINEAQQHNEAIEKLRYARNADGSYDFNKLADYVRKDSSYTNIIRLAGFEDSEKLINDIEKYNNRPMYKDDYVKQYFQDRYWDLPSYMGGNLKLNKIKPSDTTTIPLLESRLNEASNAYVEKYGVKAAAESAGAKILSPVFAPARALRPDVEIKDISKLEWGIGVAQAALIFSPLIGKGVGKIAGTMGTRIGVTAIEVSAGGLFTYETVKEWNNMTPAQRGISIGFDILILGSAARGIMKSGVLRDKVNISTSTAKKEINKIITKEIPKTGNGKIQISEQEVNNAISNLENAIKNQDAAAIKKAGNDISEMGTKIPGKDGDILKLRGKAISDKAELIVKIAEKRLNMKQLRDITERLGNNADFIKSPSEKVIRDYQALNNDIIRINREIQNHQHIINEIERESLKGTKKQKQVNITRQQAEIEKVKLRHEISKDNIKMSEALERNADPAELHNIGERIKAAQERLAELESLEAGGKVDYSKMKKYLDDQVDILTGQLREKQTRLNKLMQNDELTRKFGVKIAEGEKPGVSREPSEGGPTERGKTKTATITEKKVQLEKETKTETKPDIDKLIKAKEKYKTSIKEKPGTKTQTKPAVKPDIDADIVVIAPRVAGGKYLTLVWENGHVYEKWVESKPLIEGGIKTFSQTATQAEIQTRLQQLTRTMTVTKAAEIISQEYGNPDLYPFVMGKPLIKTGVKAEPKPAVKQKIKTQTKTATATKEITKTETKPQPLIKPLAKTKVDTSTQAKREIKEKIKTGVKTGEKSENKTRIRPPNTATDKEKREYLDGVAGLVARRRGMLHGKSVYLVDYYPYGKDDKLVVIGTPPAGAKTVFGKGSMKASLTLIKGIPPAKKIFWNTGAVDDVVTSINGKLVVSSFVDKNPGKTRAKK